MPDVYDGTATYTGTVTYWDGTQELSATMASIPPGYASYSVMTGTGTFYVAHRGGSNDWPEMSMMAYTNSVAWGCPALEVSLNRTQDGVWVGVHDADLNRTSMTSGLPPVSSMTWAQVQQYRIKLLNGNEPYIRIEELLERYAASHILYIDPKNAVAQASEMFAIVKSYPNWQNHVMKYFHSSTSFATAAHNAGWKTWGYYYEADVPQIPTTSPYWDMLGMDYTASSSAWTAILAPGKRVIGHVIPDSVGANTALSKGATALICAGVHSIVPHTGV